ncbi:hypothetical protein AMK28_20770 [Streptomyces sp. CB02115]|nr:hypothetical protein [Streptomyces sp. CB02115]OKJ54521.1 hypothetical protein AMK28_20770 [Streptomyces sp. CB02115]
MVTLQARLVTTAHTPASTRKALGSPVHETRTDDRDVPELQPLEGMHGADLDGIRLRDRVAPQTSRGNAGLPEPLHRLVAVLVEPGADSDLTCGGSAVEPAAHPLHQSVRFRCLRCGPEDLVRGARVLAHLRRASGDPSNGPVEHGIVTAPHIPHAAAVEPLQQFVPTGDRPL